MGQKYQDFLKWVEGTNLFAAIRDGTKNHLINSLDYLYGAEYRIKYNGNELSLNKGVIVREAKDLPKELLLEFFINSPFYTHLEYEQNRQIGEMP